MIIDQQQGVPLSPAWLLIEALPSAVALDTKLGRLLVSTFTADAEMHNATKSDRFCSSAGLTS